MVAPSNAPVHELRTANGAVFAVVVSPEEFARLQAETQALREQVATLQRQKNYYVNELLNTLKTWMPQPIQVSASFSGVLSRYVRARDWMGRAKSLTTSRLS